MSKLNSEEKIWLNKLQKILDECPSERLGFYTIGDNDLSVYDLTKTKEINELHHKTNRDYPACIEESGAEFNYYLTFPAKVEGVAG
ncbi:hypothetical protein [Photorhabdus laumondii]|uniref:Photorhabdus luminescens subsp. laumondii TTO1 complete genome segment 10/17 n=1 Tax=Photorhabdus laumondii subsp. laumondii (strain DSM 15139 / CIP 105565 / TT01) TaxID=243265 RepID=Q7N2Z2_PHOLL|nr:hypothetical protein [Photorhabdus laumondii]AWK42638.1 hypothetical protein A4R40_14625 [Photorhabdus laumondii subsp. laumondii]AXG47962.1 hypothetical protein PluTT01m_15045 [Photorhabdus laumondii subsp. laumondii]CAE15305.1 unnamed protein product [Photorhabdus laumondii subsp. laumondii TTO1]